MKRIDTGIKGLDELIQGGFPEGSTNLVTGAPGTGKQFLGYSFLLKELKMMNQEFIYHLENQEKIWLNKQKSLIGISKIWKKTIN